jgi:hypothetical protein
MWPTFKTDKPFEPPDFTKTDIALVSLVWGFTVSVEKLLVLLRSYANILSVPRRLVLVIS